jgi:AbrB family looped-hinge helix DNA binding protein
MSKVTAKFQITIPQDIRKDLCINPGSHVDIIKENNKFILVVNPIEEIKKDGAESLKTGKLLMII